RGGRRDGQQRGTADHHHCRRRPHARSRAPSRHGGHPVRSHAVPMGAAAAQRRPARRRHRLEPPPAHPLTPSSLLESNMPRLLTSIALCAATCTMTALHARTTVPLELVDPAGASRAVGAVELADSPYGLVLSPALQGLP